MTVLPTARYNTLVVEDACATTTVPRHHTLTTTSACDSMHCCALRLCVEQ